jgi:hypothetical protein
MLVLPPTIMCLCDSCSYCRSAYFVGRAVDVAFRLGLAFGAAVEEAVTLCPAVLSC